MNVLKYLPACRMRDGRIDVEEEKAREGEEEEEE